MFVGIFLYLQITQKQDSFLIIISHYFRKSCWKKMILFSSYKLSHFEKWYFLPTAVEDERCPKKCNICNYLFQILPWITSDENQSKKWVGHNLNSLSYSIDNFFKVLRDTIIYFFHNFSIFQVVPICPILQYLIVFLDPTLWIIYCTTYIYL